MLVAALCLVGACFPAMKLTTNDADVVLARQTIAAPDPSQTGAFAVRTLSYGSGTDKHRAIYRDAVAWRTEPVDASKLVDLGRQAKSRNKYWGFTPKKMPLNARVWYPDGSGPFPLLLIAHGNHDMKDYSDPGYAYLGELLASRGYIVASLDMNFINGGIRNENDARAWFFLKHLEQWRRWNDDPAHPFHGRVDMDRIAIAGHSRGGEAVGLAATFNQLDRYPDDATITFDFHFHIRSVIAIAPVDGQYKPANRLMPVENVNYLVFHGSHDGDVTSFGGLRQYQRVRFTDGERHFKAAVLVYRANHGQWNTVWGAHDNGPRSSRTLDLRTLMPAEDQRQFAKVYVSAFLDATLRDDERYLPLFRDYRVAGDWLPKTMYINRFEESSFEPVADYEDDVDVTTGTAPGVRLEGEHLSTWKESLVQLRSSTAQTLDNSMFNNVVTLGWNNHLAGDDEKATGPPATYTVQLPATFGRDHGLDAGASLQFLLMPTDAMPGARKPEGDEASAPKPAAKPKPKPPKDAPKPPVDLSVELVDGAGRTARLPLSDYGVIRRPLEAWILRRRDLDTSRFGEHFELVMQTFTLPLGDFRRANPSLDLGTLAAVRFVFDRAEAGTVVVDEIGFAHMPQAFAAGAIAR
jgi:dienelactone hydrolase